MFYYIANSGFDKELTFLDKKDCSRFISTLEYYRVKNSYTRYFNAKYKKRDPIFQESFKSVRIEDGKQLLYVSRYIHLKPLIEHVVRHLKKFPFSSYHQYLRVEDGLCQKEEVLSHFKDPKDYEKFVLDKEDYQRSKLNFLE